VTPRNVVQQAYDAGVDLTKGIPGVLTVHVAGDRTSQAEISVTRGAAIDGRVLWDDGSPVSGATVMVTPAVKSHKELPRQFGMMAAAEGAGAFLDMTDDRGHYRIAGLAPGAYVVAAGLQTRAGVAIRRGAVDLGDVASGAATTPLMVYAPGAFHRGDAKPVMVDAGEEHDDEDVTFSLSGTHSVSGRVASSEDHHGIDSGQVTLKDATDKSFTRSAGLDAEGSFTITFVPPGTYTLEIEGAADTVPAKAKSSGGLSFAAQDTVRSYEGAKQSVIVTDNDVTGQNIELMPAKSGAKSGASGASTE
jgi:hypothetical protein